MSTKQPGSFKETAERWCKAFDRPLTFLLLVFTLAGVYFAAVEWRVRSIVKDPDFIVEVARRARPAIVFDSEGRVLADAGALTFLRSPPEVQPAPKGETEYHTRITIRPQTVLPAEPIVEALDYANVSVTTRRIRGTSWEILIGYRGRALLLEDQPTDPPPGRYRLEIIPP